MKTSTNYFSIFRAFALEPAFDSQTDLRWFLGLNRLFLFTVVLPTLLTALYYVFIASDVYVCDSSFVVESVRDQQGIGSQLGSLISTSLSGAAGKIPPTWRSSLLSTTPFRQPSEAAGFAKLSRRLSSINRFAGLVWWDKSFETLYKCYSDWVVTINPSGRLPQFWNSVRAFSAKEANTS